MKQEQMLRFHKQENFLLCNKMNPRFFFAIIYIIKSFTMIVGNHKIIPNNFYIREPRVALFQLSISVFDRKREFVLRENPNLKRLRQQ